MQYRNPVIAGFYPDPSVCRADGKFYLVCSSFQYFPGVPLFESSDLVNWEQIGHVLTRESQLPLNGANSVGGIYAPTIRYHAGRFYMVTTNVSGVGHFYVWTDDIRGEWSEPVRVDQEGIDPSLFFEDGKAYFMSNGSDPEGRSCILQCEIDIETGERISETRAVWYGTGGRFLESPHLYHIGRWYYLMASEGGTEYGHMVVYARGESVYGPFTPYAGNPVLTNRNLGGYPMQGCGHADLAEDESGNWWMLHLGFRQIDPWMMFHTTGREVSLVPVTFDADGWFTAGDNGTSRLLMQTDRLPADLTQKRRICYDFRNTKPGLEWVWLQNPDAENYRFTADAFLLRGTGISISSEAASPAWIGIRQTEMDFSLAVTLHSDAYEAGVTVYMTASMHCDLFIRKTGNQRLLVRRTVLGTLIHEDTANLPAAGDVTLRVTGAPLLYHFAAECGSVRKEMGALESRYLSTELAGNFTGVMLALFAEDPSADRWARFSDFLLQISD